VSLPSSKHPAAANTILAWPTCHISSVDSPPCVLHQLLVDSVVDFLAKCAISYISTYLHDNAPTHTNTQKRTHTESCRVQRGLKPHVLVFSLPKAKCTTHSTHVKDTSQTSANAALHNHWWMRHSPSITPSTHSLMSSRLTSQFNQIIPWIKSIHSPGSNIRSITHSGLYVYGTRDI